MQNNTCVGVERPVVVLTATVDACKRFFVQQAAEAVFASDVAHERHEQHIVVHCQVTFFVDWCKFKLVRSHLIVTRLAGNAQFQGLDFQIAHKFCHALRNSPKIVVFHLLVFRTIVSHQRATGEQKVRASGIKTFVYQEIFLFPTQIGGNFLHIIIEISANFQSRLVHCCKRFFERSFIVQCFTCITDEHGRNHERIADDKHRTSRVPSCVAARFKGGTNTTVGE